MTAVLLTLHTLIVIALVGVVLLQRSEGGALGMGGGGGNFLSGRGTADVLTRSTTALGAAFFATSLLLAITSDRGISAVELRQELIGEEEAAPTDPSEIDASDIFDFGDEAPTAPTPNPAADPAVAPETDDDTSGAVEQ
ncbi:hypothetical protein PB2503_13214 [Parvularcula bermudensis HTCC2503]|uniref:Protein-export membrane protein SecG n=1 Tax=Parvularcula bermudensis (strain ATCC BAA-594 / HTCC2503 / KCTC 12087) TaxID=314260 RepID=E0TGS1_PARBH|nr:preprotein translocase subunit SecG [Parvularcula bermudensis]ADM10680.1 hypothetical protein PB2503_13214 [Parvularcula bermudensis HTCC2503]